MAHYHHLFHHLITIIMTITVHQYSGVSLPAMELPLMLLRKVRKSCTVW